MDHIWAYSYSPFGERESKKEIKNILYGYNIGDYTESNNYYLLGLNNEQMIVYYGHNVREGVFPRYGVQGDNCKYSQQISFYYPGEFNVYGADGLSTYYQTDINGELVKRVRIQDYLGNVRSEISPNLLHTQNWDYDANGKPLALSDHTNQTNRLSYIGKERDFESGYHNFGFRQYDDILGRFMSIDPLWYEQLNWSPYHNCGNDPVNGRDPDGKKLKYIGDEKQVAQLKEWTSKIQRTFIGSIVVNSLKSTNELIKIGFGELEDEQKNNKLLIMNGKYSMNMDITDAFDMSSDKYGESTFNGGTITLDKSKKTFKGHITLGHEMWHAFEDLRNSILDDRDKNETRAEQFELYLEKLQNVGILKSIFMPMPKLEMKRGKR